jgi:hypothetical protein
VSRLVVPQELLADCINRTGWRTGARLALFCQMWAIAEDELGRELSPEDYVEWSDEGRSTIYRRLKELREAFPGVHTPHGLVTISRRERSSGRLTTAG